MSNPPEINPYASPQKFDELPPSGARPIAPALPWEPTQAIRFGWDAALRQPLVVLAWFVGTSVGSVFTIIGAVAQAILIANHERELGMIVYLSSIVLGLPLQMWMQLGLLRYTLKLVRGQTPAFGEIFAGGPFLPFLGVSLLVGLGVSLGMLL